MTYERVLTALADPTRRRIFARLRRRAYSVGEIARLARISQPGASQHLQVLRRARLVTERREGVRRYYRANAEGLGHLRRYLEAAWDEVLTAFADDAVVPRGGKGVL